MAIQLVRTKFCTPLIRSDTVSRSRLLEQLNAGLNRKLTLISAPAGFGKTTLLGEWVTGCGQIEPEVRIAWLSLERSDNDPAYFWEYLIAALQIVTAGAAKDAVGKAALALLRSAQSPPIETILTTLINEIAVVPGDFALILDDYHVIEIEIIHNALTFLLDHLPPQLHLIIASRSDPPLPLSRLRGRGDLTELKAADLRFTLDEATVFLNRVMGLDLLPGDVAVLDSCTEGWIAGLQMAALSIRGRGKEHVADFISTLTGGHHHILDYLTDEVLLQQPESVQTFLLQTAILDNLNGSLCDAVRFGFTGTPSCSKGNTFTDQDDSQTMLERLEKINLFTVSLDDERHWYRYHRLFSDVLRSRLEKTQPDLIPTLHRRASEWYARNGPIGSAIGHALAAGDIDRAAHLIEDNILATMDYGELDTVAGWLDALPEGIVRSRPWLCVARAWVLAYTGQLNDIESLLQGAEEALVQSLPIKDDALRDEVKEQRIVGHITAIRAYCGGLKGNSFRAAELAREALVRLPKRDLMARGLAATTLGTALRLGGDLAAATQAFDEALAINRAAGDSHITVSTLCDLAMLNALQGNLHKVASICQDAIQLANRCERQIGWQLPAVGYAHALMSRLQCEWYNLETALRYAEKGLKLCKQWGQADTWITCCFHLAAVLQEMGDIDGALSAIREAKRVADGLSVWYVESLEAYEAGMRLAQGNVAAATRWAQKCDLSIHDEFSFQNELGYLMLARIHIAQGKEQSKKQFLDDALELLEWLLDVVVPTGAKGSVIRILVAQAVALQAQDEKEQALATLERALNLAEPEGYVGTFVSEGAPMEDLLRQAAVRGIAVNYVNKLLATLESRIATQRKTKPSSSILVESLSKREMEVLRLLAAGLSNKEIAQTLIIAVNTVKNHLKNIYGKLGVHSRTQAVDNARSLGIL